MRSRRPAISTHPAPLDHPALEPVWQGRKTLRSGSTSKDAVTALQQTLVALLAPITVDGDFGPRTTRAVQVMQAARGLTTDGVVGPKTLEGLAAALTAPPLRKGMPVAFPAYAPSPRAGEPLVGLYRHDAFPGRIAFTFDDGPSTTYTPRVLDLLRRAGICATFYPVGSRAAGSPDLVRRVAAEGHRIGNHSWDHPDFMKISGAEVTSQIDRTRDGLSSILGRTLGPDVRPPYGSPFHSVGPPASEYWEPVGKRIAATGARLMMWQVDTWDWKYSGQPALVVGRFLGELDRAGGGALLMHDIHAQSIEALPGVIDVVRRRQLEVVSDADLLAIKYGAPTGVV